MRSEIPDVSVVIPTRNRREELLRAVASAWNQTVDVEVLVYDDASTDGSADAVVAAFPDTRVVRSARQLGYIAHRNRGGREARADYVMSFDDDAQFSSPVTLEHALDECDHERIGALALPVLNVGQEEQPRFRAPDAAGRWVTDTYGGAAALLARGPFLALGGFRQPLFHRGEEPEYTRRLLQHGLVVRLSSAPLVHHYPSLRRQVREDIYYQARSQVLQAAWGLPVRELPARLAIPVLHGLRHHQGRAAVAGVRAGIGASYRTRELRDPLDPALARLARRLESDRLRRRPTLRIDDLESQLPPLVAWPVPDHRNA